MYFFKQLLFKKYDFLVAQEQKLGARGHWALLKHSPCFKVLNNLASGNLLVPLRIYEPARCPNHSSSKKMAICYN